MSKNGACVLGVLHDTAVQNHDHIRKKKEKASIVKGSTQDAKTKILLFLLTWNTDGKPGLLNFRCIHKSADCYAQSGYLPNIRN